MDKENYMKYIVTRTQAKYRAKQDISEDTLIFEAQRYFDSKNNSKESALANFYAGNVYRQNDIVDKALEHYLKATFVAQHNNDYVLAGRSLYNIGHHYYQENIMDSAIIYYKLALDNFDDGNSVTLKMRTLRAISLTYYAIHNLEQAYGYLQEGLRLATQINNSQYQNKFTHDLGIVYREQGKYQQASRNLHSALEETTSVDSLRIYLNLSQLYNYMNRTDSVQYYTEKMKTRLSEISDIYMLRNIYASFFEYNKQEGNYSEALRYADLEKTINQKIKEENKALQLLEADKRFALEQKDKEIQSQRTNNYLYLAGGLLFLVVFVLFMIYLYLGLRKETKNVNAEINRIKNIRNSPQNMELLGWARNYLNSEPLGKEAMLKLTSNQDILFLALYMSGYSKEVIAVILNIPSQSVELRKSNICRILIEAGYSNEQINEIINVQNH